MVGARSGHLDATEEVLNASADVFALDNDKRTAAQEAITYGHQEVLRMLKKFRGGWSVTAPVAYLPTTRLPRNVPPRTERKRKITARIIRKIQVPV